MRPKSRRSGPLSGLRERVDLGSWARAELDDRLVHGVALQSALDVTLDEILEAGTVGVTVFRAVVGLLAAISIELPDR